MRKRVDSSATLPSPGIAAPAATPAPAADRAPESPTQHHVRIGQAQSSSAGQGSAGAPLGDDSFSWPYERAATGSTGAAEHAGAVDTPTQVREAPVKVGDVLADKYRIDRIIGRGGMGLVAEAWHLALHEQVAVKVLRRDVAESPEARQRFEREARTVFKLKSDHVARVLDVGALDDGTPYMVMEYLEGIDLAELLERRRVLPVRDATDYVVQACHAIGEAHTRGIIHRDLKPENLFLLQRRDGSTGVKVLDFGLSKLAGRDTIMPDHPAASGAKPALGTAAYMSPEQWLSSGDVGPATDVWSLGVILFELIAGRTPFERGQLPQTCQAILGAEPPPIGDLRPGAPAEIEAVIAKCLQKDPSRRYAEVADLAWALCPFAPAHARDTADRVARRDPNASKPTAPSAAAQGSQKHIATERNPALPAPADGAVAAAAVPLPLDVPVGPPTRTWAEILQERGQPQRRARWGFNLSAALLVALMVAMVVLAWSNRHVLDPPPPAPSSSAR